MKLFKAFIQAVAFLVIICVGIFGVGLFLYVIDMFFGGLGYLVLMLSGLLAWMTYSFYTDDEGEI